LEVGKGIIEFKEIFSQLYTKLNDLIFVLEYRTVDFEMINSSVKYINIAIPCHR
jgi:sugar phosphate isomerase/epimerase